MEGRRDGNSAGDDLSRWFSATNPRVASSQPSPDYRSSMQNPGAGDNLSRLFSATNPQAPSSQAPPGNHSSLQNHGAGDNISRWFSVTNPQAPSSQPPPDNHSSPQNHGAGDNISRWFSVTNPQAPSSQPPPDNHSSPQNHGAGDNISRWFSVPNLQAPSSQLPSDNHSSPQNHGVRDNISRWFSATNPQGPSSQPPLDNHSSLQSHVIHPNPFMENNVSRNYTSPINFSLNPFSHNYFPGNHIPVPENQPQNLSLRYPYYQNPNQPNYFLENPNLQNQRADIFYPAYSQDTLRANPSFHGQNVQNNSSSRLSQSAPSRRHQFLNNYSYSGSSNMSYPLENQQITDFPSLFDRLRIEQVARRFDDCFVDLGLSQPNSAVSPNNQYGNLHTASGRRHLDAATNRYPIDNNVLSFHNGNSARPIGIRFGLESAISRSQSFNESIVESSSMYNNADVRPRHCPINSVEEVRGRIASAAKEQLLSRFLQRKVDERNPKDIEMILSEVKVELHDLMLHQVANYLIQKIIGVLSEEQMTELILLTVSSPQSFFRICDDENGSRVMQKLLDVNEYRDRRPLTADQKTFLVTALKNVTLTLSKSVHGHHVIERCLQTFPYEYTRDLLEEIADNCVNLATDKSGCCLLQKCILHAQEEQKRRLIAGIVADALFLSEDSYGNYVVQFVLGLKIPQVTNDIVAQLAGSYYGLSQGKCSSNVVEKCLRESGEEQSYAIISEILRHPLVLDLMLHSYGNYVIQSAWAVSEGRRIRQSLFNIVRTHAPFLQSHIYGKRVLAKVRGNMNRVYRPVW